MTSTSNLPTPLQSRLTLRPSDAASALGVGVRSVYRLIQSKRLKAYKMGDATIIRVDDLNAMLNSLPAA